MKVAVKGQDVIPTFHPVEVTFTLETQGELDALGCCFNSGFVTHALEGIGGVRNVGWHTIYQAIKRLGANLQKTDAFNKILRRE